MADYIDGFLCRVRKGGQGLEADIQLDRPSTLIRSKGLRQGRLVQPVHDSHDNVLKADFSEVGGLTLDELAKHEGSMMRFYGVITTGLGRRIIVHRWELV